MMYAACLLYIIWELVEFLDLVLMLASCVVLSVNLMGKRVVPLPSMT